MKFQVLATASVALLAAGAPSILAAPLDSANIMYELDLDVKDSTFNGRPRSRMPMLKNPPNLRRVRPLSRSGGRPWVSEGFGKSPSAYGTKKWPYTTSLVKPQTKPKKKDLNNVATSSKPFLAAGKLHMTFASGGSVCSGSLIGKGIVVTAAHCVSSFGGGSAGLAKSVTFIPGASKRSNQKKSGPIGTWKVSKMVIPSCYVNGTCANLSNGVISSNDIAILLLSGNKNKLPWKKGAGYYLYAANGYGFITGSEFASTKSMAQITQLGYPGAIGDKSSNVGGAMIRTDSVAMYYQPKTGVKNLIWGSAQTGGSSGGPELVNFGNKPYYGSGSYAGLSSVQNVVIGTTSWGYTSPTANVQGASWFGTNSEYPSASYTDTGGKNWGPGNIGSLMRTMCGKGYGGYQAKGYCLN